ncbi:MAG TPA: phosphorylated adapter RNA export RNA-binding domain-containing protein [Polyangiaceae bacterium]|jgi:hypothetical protein|nr:phosphorylated adapter RNA export RNA-binding domain-containing protein [Polyangiaceae bacterium]
MATDEAVTTIAESLKETDELPRKQIAEIVEVLGSDVALSLLAEVRRVQDEGGIEVRDGTRRRTDGGVFFSLAKGKLPKSDRNRIFRVRPPKLASDGAEEGGQQTLPLPEAPPRPVPVRPVAAAAEEKPRPVPPAVKQIPATGPLGRRRVVEVEVLRTHARPALERVPEVRAPVAPRQATAVREELKPEPQEVRPLRRIVTVAPKVQEEAPPSTPEAAAEKLRASIKGLKVGEQRKVVLELLREIGGLPEPPVAKKPPPEPKKPEPPPPPPPPQRGLDGATRERVLAAVTDALGLSTADLAEVLYGDDSPSLRAKARTALDRFRKS